jgi:hypothetical protein
MSEAAKAVQRDEAVSHIIFIYIEHRSPATAVRPSICPPLMNGCGCRAKKQETSTDLV